MSELPTLTLSRRGFLAGASAAAASAALSGCGTAPVAAPAPAGAAAGPVKRVAAINTVYRMRSHAYHIVGRFIHGYSREGVHHQPPFKLVRMYNDQFPEDDLSRDLAKRKGFCIAKTVAEALGGDTLDVDAVLLIAEHGDYPKNDRSQILYPRHKLFMEIAAHFRKVGRTAPVFNDKHLSYDHALAREMVQTSRKMGFGLMAGSSLPVTWRRPELEFDVGTPITEALVCHAGGTEVYGCHALETLQCMMERRAGGETGIRSVTALKGPAVWKAGDAGLWSRDLLEAALSRSPSRNIGDPRDNVAEPVAFLVEYRDGTRGATLDLAEHVADITFAAKVAGRPAPASTLFDLPAPPGAKYFDALTWNIERFFAAGTPPYPLERTLLTTTALDFAMRSLHENGRRYEDPALHIRYRPPAADGHFRGRTTDAG